MSTSHLTQPVRFYCDSGCSLTCISANVSQDILSNYGTDATTIRTYNGSLNRWAAAASVPYSVSYILRHPSASSPSPKCAPSDWWLSLTTKPSDSTTVISSISSVILACKVPLAIVCTKS